MQTLTMNGEAIPPSLIQAEALRLSRHPHRDPNQTELQLRQIAEHNVVNTVLFRQAMELWDFEIDDAEIDAELKRLMQTGGCGPGSQASHIRAQLIEAKRAGQVMETLAPHVRKPDAKAAERFYQSNRSAFRLPDLVRAAHIVRNIDANSPDDEARKALEAAEAELQSGVPFASVAARYSDCKGSGSDLEPFARGTMVEEFEDAVLALKPGERTPIFRTPFGLHIAEFRGLIPSRQQPFKEVRADIEGMLALRARQEAYEFAVSVLRKQSQIERTEVAGEQAA